MATAAVSYYEDYAAPKERPELEPPTSAGRSARALPDTLVHERTKPGEGAREEHAEEKRFLSDRDTLSELWRAIEHSGDVSTGHPEVPWLSATYATLLSLLSLPEGWDSYGAAPINPRTVSAAVELLDRTANADTPPPAVVPTSRGGIQFEWHRFGMDLEVEILPKDAALGVFLFDATTGDEREERLTSDISPLTEAMRLLSERGRQERAR